MNLCLIRPHEYIDHEHFALQGARLLHIRDVLGLTTGDSFQVGEINSKLGIATIVAENHDSLTCCFDCQTTPITKPDIELVVALPRPKMLKRLLRTSAELGVRRIVLLNTWKVEKSYWQSPFLAEDIITEQLLLGLEQAKDTVLPEVILAKRFKPFVEDELPSLLQGREGWLAHPGEQNCAPSIMDRPRSLFIGPEGGFTPYEIDMLIKAGCHTFNLGPRILRVETAVTASLAKFTIP